MKNYFLLFLAIIFIASCEKDEDRSYPDRILAGQVSGAGIKYFDIRPDTALAFNYPTSGGRYNLDIDKNGTDDVAFLFGGSASPGHQIFSNTAITLNETQIAISKDGQLLVDTLVEGTIINDDLTWVSDTCTIYKSSWYGGTGSGSGLWYDSKHHYIGLKIGDGDDQIFAWIKMHLFGPSSMTFTEYGYTQGY